MNIVIMGATSHIAKGLIDRFLHRGDDHMYLFSRSGEKVEHFLDAIGGPGKGNHTICTDYRAFSSFSYDSSSIVWGSKHAISMIAISRGILR